MQVNPHSQLGISFGAEGGIRTHTPFRIEDLSSKPERVLKPVVVGANHLHVDRTCRRGGQYRPRLGSHLVGLR